MKIETIHILLLLLIVLGLVSCDSTSFKNPNKSILESLDKTDNPSTLILVVSENMCSDCIYNELINIQSNKKVLDNIIVIGLFSRERYFYSFMKEFKSIKTLYIQSDLIDPMPRTVYYSFYNKEQKNLENTLYADPCNSKLTYQYYLKMDELLTNF